MTKKVFFLVACCSIGASSFEPAVFLEGIVSTQDDEFGGTLSPDGHLFFFCKKAPATGRSNLLVLCFSELKQEHWSEVSVAPFSGKYRDFNPRFSPDGSRLYFMSNRPVDDKPKTDSDIWYVEKANGGWSQPKHLSDKVNSPWIEYSCSFTKEGDMYLSSGRNGKDISIYVSRFSNGEYQEPERLDTVINSGPQQLDACIAPDGSYILFTAAGRDDMLLPKQGAIYPRSDLYISRQKNNQWSTPVRLPEPINSTADESSPFISSDGKTLFFSSERSFVNIPMERITYSDFEKRMHSTLNGFGNIFYVDTEILKEK